MTANCQVSSSFRGIDTAPRDSRSSKAWNGVSSAGSTALPTVSLCVTAVLGLVFLGQLCDLAKLVVPCEQLAMQFGDDARPLG